jgi:hypothetical protein
MRCSYMERGDAEREGICCVQEAGKQKKPYKAEWAGYEERRRSLQKRVIYICSQSKNEYGRTEKAKSQC